MSDKRFQVLFIGRNNAARSLMAESLLRRWGMGRFDVHSAAPEPLDQPHPAAIELLQKVGIDTGGLQPKSWDRFATTEAPAMDFIFFTDEETARHQQPQWPGQPMIAHWNFPDPLSLKGSETERHALLNLVFGMIERRVKIFCALPDHRLAKLTAAEMSDMATGNHAA